MGTTSPRSIVEEPPPPAPKEAIGEIKFLEQKRMISQDHKTSTKADSSEYSLSYLNKFNKTSQLRPQVQNPIHKTTQYVGSNISEPVVQNDGRQFVKEAISMNSRKTYKVKPIAEFDEGPSSMDVIKAQNSSMNAFKMEQFPSLREKTYIKLEQFIPGSCSGILKRKNTNFYENFGVNAFLISSNLLIASSQEINRYQRHQLIFFSYFKQEQFEIQEILQNDRIGEDGKEPLKVCLIRLKKEIQLHRYHRLAINFQRNYESTEILSLQYINSNKFKACFTKVGEYSFDENQNVMSYSTNLGPSLDGSPIIFRKNGQCFVVGIHFKSQNQNCQYNSSGTLIQESILANLCKWMSIKEREFIQIYLLNENKLITLADFVSFLNIESSFYPSWLKFNQSSFIKKSKQMYAQRLGGYIDFSMKGRFIEYITIKGIRLYFDLYHSQKIFTILDLKQQYLQITKSNLLLYTKDIILSVHIALKSIIYNKKNREMFQKLLNEMQKQKFKISAFPKWFIEDLQRLNKTQVYYIGKTRNCIHHDD